MRFVFKSAIMANYLSVVLLAILISTLIISNSAKADKVVENLKDKISTLKASVEGSDTSDRDFSAEQEEFDRMREQLLAAENEIIKGETKKSLNQATVSADYEYKKEYQKEAKLPKNDDSFTEDLDDSLEKDARAEMAKKAIDSTFQENEELKAKYQTALTQLAARNKELTALRSEKTSVTSESKVSRDKIASLQKELQGAKNKLLVSEAEVERLSALAGSGAKHARLPAPATGRSSVYSTANSNVQTTSIKPETSDLTVLTVVASKAYLRTGPGKDNSPLMEVRSGTKLAVEDRQGNWFRVTTPTGTRAWIASEVVAFGPSSTARPSQTVKIKASSEKNDQIEEKAFELINKHSR